MKSRIVLKQPIADLRSAPKGRPGFTLIEMVTIIAIMGAVMSLSTGLLVLCFKTNQLATGQTVQLLPRHRLAKQFRFDLHRTPADQLEIDADHERILLRSKSDPQANQIQYYREGRHLIYEVRNSASQIVSRETFSWPSDFHVQWERVSGQPLLKMSILPESTGDESYRSETFPPLIVWARLNIFPVNVVSESTEETPPVPTASGESL